MYNRRTVTIATILAFVAGILYCSWPLGYLLNPVANRGLASNLEAPSQPYNWLFVGLDVVSGVLICWVSWWLYRWQKRQRTSWWLRATIFGFFIFGALTMLAAVLPLDCDASAHACVPNLHDPFFIIHGIASLTSTNGLTISIVAMWWLLVRNPKTNLQIRLFLHSTMAVWFGFGITTAYLILKSRSSAESQHLFIIVCSVWTAALPFLVRYALRLQPARATQSISRRRSRINSH